MGVFLRNLNPKSEVRNKRKKIQIRNFQNGWHCFKLAVSTFFSLMPWSLFRVSIFELQS